MTVKPKKYLGQHFLKNINIAKNITDSLTKTGYKNVLEIGPGMGVLTQFLLKQNTFITHLIELDKESIIYLKNKFKNLETKIIEKDFLRLNLDFFLCSKMAIIGNFPYNISSQILFKVLENKNKVVEIVGMFQKEVAVRISSNPGTKNYGILSVLLQAYYNIEYLFTVEPEEFHPAPKVKSGVLRIIRNKKDMPLEQEKALKRVVKLAFNQRRKILKNSLKSILNKTEDSILSKRPEQLSVDDFIYLLGLIE